MKLVNRENTKLVLVYRPLSKVVFIYDEDEGFEEQKDTQVLSDGNTTEWFVNLHHRDGQFISFMALDCWNEEHSDWSRLLSQWLPISTVDTIMGQLLEWLLEDVSKDPDPSKKALRSYRTVVVY